MDRIQWLNKIESIKERYDFSLGYHLLYCPWSTIQDSSVAFISLNPGRSIDKSTQKISEEKGNSYKIAENNSISPITKQFLELCKFLGKLPEEILTGTIHPFRSNNWNSLSNEQKNIGLKIGQEFWSEALLKVDLIICVGNVTANTIIKMLDFKINTTVASGWGNIKLKRYKNYKEQTLVHLPHLSTFRIFSRNECRDSLTEVFKRS